MRTSKTLADGRNPGSGGHNRLQHLLRELQAVAHEAGSYRQWRTRLGAIGSGARGWELQAVAHEVGSCEQWRTWLELSAVAHAFVAEIAPHTQSAKAAGHSQCALNSNVLDVY
jgi:hypothetical protein